MICDPCKRGDHCGTPGPVGQRTGHCPCQHRPPGTGQTVCQHACTHPQDGHLPGRGCTVPGCPCLWRAQDAAPAPVSQAPEGVRDLGDLTKLTHAPAALTADPDHGVLGGVPTLSLLTEYLRLHSRGALAGAAMIRSELARRLGRDSL